MADQPSSFRSKRTGPSRENVFPSVLFRMLESCSDTPDEDVLAWMPDGKAFIIKDRERLVTQILPRFSRQTKFKSFQRQLNLWGFRAINNGRHDRRAGGTVIFHPKFRRHAKHLCETIQLGEVDSEPAAPSANAGIFSSSEPPTAAAETDLRAESEKRSSPLPDLPRTNGSHDASAISNDILGPFTEAQVLQRVNLLRRIEQERMSQQIANLLLVSRHQQQQQHAFAAANRFGLFQNLAAPHNLPRSALPNYSLLSGGLPAVPGGTSGSSIGAHFPSNSLSGSPNPHSLSLCHEDLVSQLASHSNTINSDALVQQQQPQLPRLSVEQVMAVLLSRENGNSLQDEIQQDGSSNQGRNPR